MKRWTALALRELMAHKRVSCLILIAVILSTTFTAAVSQSAGVLSAMRQQQAIALGGNRYATFVQLTERQAQTVEQDPRICYASRYVSLGSLELNGLLSLSLAEYQDPEVLSPRLLSGRLPEAPTELALPEDALGFLGLSGALGETVPLTLSKALRHGLNLDAYEYETEFTLVGITQSNYLGYTSGNILGLAGPGTAEMVLPPEYLYYNVDFRTADKKTFQETVDSLEVQLGLHELDTLYNVPYLNALGVRHGGEGDGSALEDGGFSWLLAAGVLTAGLILLAAGLVIYNILKIAVSQRTSQYGVLRAIGAERGQLYGVVALEVLLLCAAGIPAGLLLGGLSAEGLLTAALRQLPPEMFLAPDAARLDALVSANSGGKGSYLLLSAAVTLAFAFLAAAPAAWLAAKVSPVSAMTGVRQMVRRSRKARPIRHFERQYAWLNLGRNRGRTAITILSLVMSITVFVTLQSVLERVSVSGGAAEHLGDYSIVNQSGGIAPSDLAALEAEAAVEWVAAEQFAFYSAGEEGRPEGIETSVVLGLGESFQIYGMNGLWLDWALSESLTPEALEAVKAGEGCVVRNPIPMEINGETYFDTVIEEGSVLTIAGRTLPVVKTLNGYDGYFSVGTNGFYNGVQVLVSDGLYPFLTGSEAYAELRPALAPDADREAFDGFLSRFCQRTPGTEVLSYEQVDRQIVQSEAQMKFLGWSLILFVGFIGILNIINTVAANIQTRVTEIGVQRAIGMSAGSLYRTFLWEGAYYGLIAAAAGCAAGYGGTALIEWAAAGSLPLPPVGAMLEASGASVAACLLATAALLGKFARLSIVDAMETVE